MASISLIHKLSLLHYLPMSSHSILQQVCYIRSIRSHEVYRVMVVDVGLGGGAGDEFRRLREFNSQEYVAHIFRGMGAEV